MIITIASGTIILILYIFRMRIDGYIDYAQPYEVYGLDGVKVSDSKEGLVKGIYVLRQGMSAVKIAVK